MSTLDASGVLFSKLLKIQKKMKYTEKYKIEFQREQKINLPIESQILSVVLRRDEMLLYVLVDEYETQVEERKIVMVETGIPLPKGYDYNYITSIEYIKDDVSIGVVHFYEVLT